MVQAKNTTNEETHYIHAHQELGPIAGRRLRHDQVQFRSLPYAFIKQRFARSQRLDSLPTRGCDRLSHYDATVYGPSSIQPVDSLAMDIRWNQLPPEAQDRQQVQHEDCLKLTITCPLQTLEQASKPLPVVVFSHGGALMVGSGDRDYYDPTQFCTDAAAAGKPMIFVSINYRLGALGFMHCPKASDLLPPNNGLYDQINGLRWVAAFIRGFGGDPLNITAIGQSAGAASLSLHNSHPRKTRLYRRAIVLSGSSVVLVTMSPKEHQTDFLRQAAEIGIETANRSPREIALDMIAAPLSSIRNLKAGGAPCSDTELIPSSSWATMASARHTPTNTWLESQILSSCTFDGSISYMVALGQARTNLAPIFIAICQARMKSPTTLLDIYDISAHDSDEVALEKICQIVTDLGFFAPAISHAIGAAGSSTSTFLQLFDISNPFVGLLEEDRFATHTWDVVALLGPYDHLVPNDSLRAIRQWRSKVVEYIYSGAFPCEAWSEKSADTLLVSRDGLEKCSREHPRTSRAHRLVELAEREGGEKGGDILWDRVVRFFLATGDARHARESEEYQRLLATLDIQ